MKHATLYIDTEEGKRFDVRNAEVQFTIEDDEILNYELSKTCILDAQDNPYTITRIYTSITMLGRTFTCVFPIPGLPIYVQQGKIVTLDPARYRLRAPSSTGDK